MWVNSHCNTTKVIIYYIATAMPAAQWSSKIPFTVVEHWSSNQRVGGLIPGLTSHSSTIIYLQLVDQ